MQMIPDGLQTKQADFQLHNCLALVTLTAKEYSVQLLKHTPLLVN
jgi:hypothetical protein